MRRVGQLWSFIDKSDKMVVAPKYFLLGQFSEGLAGAMDGASRWGYIDRSGKYVVPAKFTECRFFSEGLAGVRTVESKKWGFIDKNGTMRNAMPNPFPKEEYSKVSTRAVELKSAAVTRAGRMFVFPLMRNPD